MPTCELFVTLCALMCFVSAAATLIRGFKSSAWTPALPTRKEQNQIWKTLKNPEIQSTVINLPKSDEQMARWWQAQWKLPHLASCCLWPMMVYVSWSFMIHYVFVFAASATFLSSSRTRWFDRESCSYQGHLGNALVIFSLWISAVIACDWQILAVYSGIMDHPFFSRVTTIHEIFEFLPIKFKYLPT